MQEPNKASLCFLFNKRTVDYCKTYKYLGTTLDEFFNFDRTAEAQAEAAGQALGAVITKTINNGGLPFKIYTMHVRAARCFLGLHKSAAKLGYWLR